LLLLYDNDSHNYTDTHSQSPTELNNHNDGFPLTITN